MFIAPLDQRLKKKNIIRNKVKPKNAQNNPSDEIYLFPLFNMTPCRLCCQWL
jgi:hypothetical protein